MNGLTIQVKQTTIPVTTPNSYDWDVIDGPVTLLSGRAATPELAFAAAIEIVRSYDEN